MPTIRKRHGQWQVRWQVQRHVLPAVKFWFALCLMGLVPAGCAQPWDPETDGNAIACRSTYNFMPGSPEYEQCMQRFRDIDAGKKGGRIL